MAWIKTAKGNLLNLDKISTVEIHPERGGYYLLAWEPVGPGPDNGNPYAEHNDLIPRPATKEQAEAALAAIQKLVRAQTVEELIDGARVDESTRPGFRRT